MRFKNKFLRTRTEWEHRLPPNYIKMEREGIEQWRKHGAKFKKS